MVTLEHLTKEARYPRICLFDPVFFAMHFKLNMIFLVWVIIIFLGTGASANTYKDILGREITLDAPPARIIPLAPSLTEILYFLGLGDRVVGVTKHSTYPEEALHKPRVGSYVDLNVEKIISLSPALVIGTVDGNSQSLVSLLDQAGVKVFIVNPRNVKQAIETIETLGRVCGVSENARDLCSKLRKRVSYIEKKTRSLKKPKVFLKINLKPIMTVNRNTFHNDIIRLCGGRNLFRDEPITYPRISLEEVIRRRPEVIIISSMERAGKFEEARKGWLKWDSIPAVRDGRVHLIDSDIIDRPSPRIVDGLEKMARLIHPEIAW